MRAPSLSCDRKHGLATTILVGLATITLRSTTADARDLGIGIVQPATYASASGTYQLRVEPADRFGKTSARYRLTRDNAEMWSGDKEYTLQEVTLTDEGTAAGMAYRSIAGSGSKDSEPDSFLHIVILDSHGRELLNEISLRRSPPWMSNPPTPRMPYVERFLADPPNDRLIVQTQALSDESMFAARWTTYRLSTGKQIATKGIEPPLRFDDRYVSLLSLRSVGGTPLLLTHWLVKNKDYKVKDESGLLALFDPDYNSLWTFEAPKDYAELDLFSRSYMGFGPAEYFERNPAVLPTDARAAFELRLFATNERVSFLVKSKSGGGYDVLETDRVPFAAVAEPSGTPDPLRALPYLGELILETRGGNTSPFDDIADFTFTDRGDVCFLRVPKGEPRLLVCAEPDGSILSERPFEANTYRHWAEAGRSDGNRFLMVRSVKRTEQHGYDTSFWWVDLRTGEETLEPCEEDSTIRSVGHFADGACVVLKGVRRGGALAEVLAYFKPDHSVGWIIDNKGAYRGGQTLGVGPDQVLVTSDQRIVVFSMGSTWILDRNGNVIRSLPRGGLGGSGASDGEGGFVIMGQESPPMLLRYRSDGTLRSEIPVRYPDGRTFSIRQVRVAPNGRLWVNDSQSLMRLREDGVVDLTLGRAASTQRLDRLAGFTMDRSGLLYAVAQGLGTVHVFDPTGKLLRVIEPDPTDVPGTVNQAFIAVNDAGEIFVKKQATVAYLPPDDYLRFSASGERLETMTFATSIPVDEYLSPSWAFQPATGYRCGMCGLMGNTRLVLVDPPSTLVREVPQRPNGRWFGFTTAIAIAPDGNIAVLNGDLSDTRRDYAVDLFAPNGDALRTIQLPTELEIPSGIAFDGRRVVVAGKRELLIVDIQGESIERFSLAPNATAEHGWSLFITPKGTELVMLERRGDKLLRYRLP